MQYQALVDTAQEQVQPLIQKIQVKHPAPIKDITNWKTYIDEKKGLSFKYPESLYQYTPENMATIFFSTENDMLTCQKYPHDAVNGYCFKGKFIFNRYDHYSSTEYLAKLNKEPHTKVSPKSYLDAQGREWSTEMVLGAASAYNFEAVTKIGDTYYTLLFQGQPEYFKTNSNSGSEKGEREFFNSILSTVEFINKN